MPVSFSNAVNAYAKAVARQGQAGLESRAEPGGGDFAGLVRDAVQSTTESLRQGETMSAAAVAGSADLTSIVTAVTNAELTLQTVVAVRDRVIQAYQEIVRMPI